jgi:uncharacterized protein YjbI with pentapeptide repeats
MANHEHLKILKQGVEQWNKWRMENRGIEPDLTGEDMRGTRLRGADLTKADLSHSDLSKANLSRAHLSGAHLTKADLFLADLSEAELREAYLSGADLSESCLTKADLSGANLGKVNLSGANLSGANLRAAYLGLVDLAGADLSGANFSEAKLLGTNFAEVDLSDAKGLESAHHLAPSTIGIDTIYQSRGKIPEAFLRGCGLQDWEIELVKLYQPDLSAADLSTVFYRVSELRSGTPIRYSSCFISYSSKDQEFADRLYADLQAKGVRCWFAPEEMKAGRKLHEQIDEAIRLHDKLLLILSEHSMSSNWVKTEIANAREREKREGKQLLFPITLVPFEAIKPWKLFDADSGIDSAREIREYFIPDFSNWKDHDSYQTAFQRLVKDLKAGAGG